MTSVALDRIEAAIRLEKPDRVPVVPIIDMFASRFGGITQHDLFFDVKKADLALAKTIDALGVIDGYHLSYAGMGRFFLLMFPSAPKLPGVDGVPADAEWQFVEKSVMEPSEYSDIVELGAEKWLYGKLKERDPRLQNRLTFAGRQLGVFRDMRSIRRSVRSWRRKGVEPMVACNIGFTPMEFFSLVCRSFNDFTLDLFRYPEEVKAACGASLEPLWNAAMRNVKMSGVRRVFLGGTRTSASAISPKQFEIFALPEWQKSCEYFASRGVTTVLHFDSDWTPFFHYFKDFPARKCVLNLDGTSDIFKAKEILGDRMCIMGDVPATLLKLGEPEEVDAYCERLIKELGRDGGFILSSGCTTPIDAKPGNVKAMIESVKRHG